MEQAILELEGDISSEAAQIERERVERRKTNHGSLLLHAGGVNVQYEDLRAFAAPVLPGTTKYHPYEHHLFVADILDQVDKVLGKDVVWSKEFAVKETSFRPKKREEYYDENGDRRTKQVNDNDAHLIRIPGGQMFGLLKLDLGDIYEGDNLVPNLGIRNSYDGSMSAGVLYGNTCFICDNTAFTGSNVFTRKHTKNAVVDLIISLREMLKDVPHLFRLDKAFRRVLKSTLMTDDDAFSVYGRLFGNKLLNITQLGVAVAEQRNPTFKEFAENNAWSVFNNLTWAKKRGNPKDSMGELEQLTSFFRERILGEAWARAVDGVIEEESARKAAYVGPLLADDFKADHVDDLDEDVDQEAVQEAQEEAKAQVDDLDGDPDFDNVQEALNELDDPNWVDPNLAFTGGYDMDEEDV